MNRYRTDISRHDDFDFVLRLRDPTSGKLLHSFPEFNFMGELWTDPGGRIREDYGEDWERMNQVLRKGGNKPYLFSKEGRILKNCLNDRGKLRVVVNNHHLGGGRLILVMWYYIENPIYPDGYRKIRKVYPLDIELTEECRDAPDHHVSSEIVVPYVYVTAYELAKANGYEGTEDEFMKALSSVGSIDGIDEETLDLLKEWNEAKDEYLRADEIEEYSDEEIKQAIDEIFSEI